MAGIFISYKREDRQAVQPIVEGLRHAGFSVWWDQDIAPDAPWETTIEHELESSKVVIVAWSEAAVASENVKAEARRGRKQGKLIQTFVEPCEPPLFFGERQGVNLSSWTGNTTDVRFQTIVAAAGAILGGRKPPQGVGYAPRKGKPWAVLMVSFVPLGAVLSVVGNVGGTRDAACSIGVMYQSCLEWGLLGEDPPVDVIEKQRERLIESVAGRWGRLDRNCVETIAYRIQRDEGGTYRIYATTPGFESVMQVMAIDPANRAITARARAPNAAGIRELWEYRPNGDVLALRDQAGTETTLGRCNEGGQ
jgi:hypothetical protein